MALVLDTSVLYAALNANDPALVQAAALQVRYRDIPLDFVDAAVFVVCEALGERKVATLDVATSRSSGHPREKP